MLGRSGVRASLTGIATARHGLAIDARGPAAWRARLARCAPAARWTPSTGAQPLGTASDFIGRVPADVLVELTPLDPRRGEPATSHVRAALRRGLHVVTANKGPVAFARRALLALAPRRGRRFLHEGAVMDGTPVFNLVERCLPGARMLGFRGLLNSTTTRILYAHGAGTRLAARPARGAGGGRRRGRPEPRPGRLGRGGEGLRDRRTP